MTGAVNHAQIERLRDENYHRFPDRRLRTVSAARAFVEGVGFCFLWPIQGIEMPNLFHAIAGRERAVPDSHSDDDLSLSWRWKDDALGKGWWYYGKLLRRRATLISLDVLPYFYALSDNFGSLDDYLQLYQDGLMSAEAKSIYEALLEHGPLDKVRLRREAKMTAKTAKSRMDRALVELEVGLQVMPVGISDAGAWNYAFVYDIVQRHLPDLPERARSIRRSEARRALVQRYLDNVVSVERKMVTKVFHVLRWTARELDRTLVTLQEEGLVQELQFAATEAPQLVSTSALEAMS